MAIETTDRSTDPSTEMQRTLPAPAYLSADFHERERAAIFHREWFCVGREEAIARTGDYLLADVAGQSVLVLRSSAGDLHAVFNVCRHRGSRLVIDDPPGPRIPGPDGRFRGSIVCPYHAWTYALTGELRAAPFLSERDGIRREDLSLFPVSVDAWGGFVFVRLIRDDAAPTLRVGFEDVDRRVERYALAELHVAASMTYDVAANWKCIVENYNECYHCGPVHPELCDVVPAFKRGGAGLDWDRGVPHRDGATTFTLSGTTSRKPLPRLTEDERLRHKGELIYPNLMLSLSADHVAAFRLRPQGPARTIVECDFLFHPEEIASSGFDPCDAVGFWDLINRQDWRICESVQRGMTALPFERGFYAPMEDLSRDIRRYVRARLGPMDETV